MAAKLLSTLILSFCAIGAFSEHIYPCADSADKDTCVGKFIAERSSCSSDLLDFSDLDSYTIATSKVEAPIFNLTGDWHDVTVLGFNNSEFVDFFYNDTSKAAVLTVFYPYFSMTGKLTFNTLTIGEEAITFTTSYTLFYSNLTITTQFWDYENFSLDDAISFVYMPAPPTNDHGASHGADVLALAAQYPQQQNLLDHMDADREGWAIETFFYRSPILAETYLNYKLCNFS